MVKFEQGEKVRVSRHVPFVGGRIGVLIKVNSHNAKVVIDRLVFEFRPANLQKA
jgi:hypothetical protein